ncbi:MAG: UTP--glucose-1-phosphate uridylyltransferase [Planctomycetota bacterium]
MHPLVETICSERPEVRDRPLDAVLGTEPSAAELIEAVAALRQLADTTPNLYHRVRALLFLHALHRDLLPRTGALPRYGTLSVEGHAHLLERRFDAAIMALAPAPGTAPSDAAASGLAAAYRAAAFQTLADQVRRSVQSVPGNEWMFAVHDVASLPLQVLEPLLTEHDGARRQLIEQTPVRLDLCHSAWSDIFFLAMDDPDGARVLNLSIDLGVRGRDAEVAPPITTSLCVIDAPVLRLHSVDLGAQAELLDIASVFDFGRDHLGLLKAAVIAAGLVPPGLERSTEDLAAVLARLCGEGRGLEVQSHVRDIPKGSRLAVSTNLLASLIAVCMRATGQTASVEGPLTDPERRLVAARAILGEWLGGSGGGWQDSGGLWPGLKRIEGRRATADDPEWGVSQGRLLPDHCLLDGAALAPDALARLRQSLVLVHGGMAQDVGPILEMVTERYLLRTPAEWAHRRRAVVLLEEIDGALRAGDIRTLAARTRENFDHVLQGIIPWATNLFTETAIARVRQRYGDGYWGFVMLGGMSGGGMGFFFEPEVAAPRARDELAALLREVKAELDAGLAFAMEPVVYDFAPNPHGTFATLQPGNAATPLAAPNAPAPTATAAPSSAATLPQLLAEHGFDPQLHESIRADLQRGALGLAHNRLPLSTPIDDAPPDAVIDAVAHRGSAADRRRGEGLLRAGAVAVVTLAAGTGSRWTRGAGVVKALHPFARLGGQQRRFLEVHLAKSEQTRRAFGCAPPHVFTTSYLTHAPIQAHLERSQRHGYGGDVHLSPGRAVGLRLVPMARDLRFLWEQLPQQRLDEQAQKMRESVQAALLAWARGQGEASDYTDNEPWQCLHPVGHWFEVANLLRNGVLADLLDARPQLEHLLLHNIDTLGASLDPDLLGQHAASGAGATFEVITRRIEDRGGGLALVDGKLRLVEALALPRETDELRLRYYSTATTWIAVDPLLAAFGLRRDQLRDAAPVAAAVRNVTARVPTYITIKDVKKRWGHGHEDVFPVAQFEKLWGDITTLDHVRCGFVEVPRVRGQQLKDPAQLDAWVGDGSAADVARRCGW